MIMKPSKLRARELFRNSRDDERLEVSYDNRGEPFEEGARFALGNENELTEVFLSNDELRRLGELITKLLKR